MAVLTALNRGGGGGGQIPPSPRDLVVASNMLRSFQQGGLLRNKQSNVYFHCNAACIRDKQPHFSFCTMPWFIRSMLTEEHVKVLGNAFPVYTDQ